MKKLNFKDVRNQKIECEDISIYEGLRASKTVILKTMRLIILDIRWHLAIYLKR